MTSPTTCTPSVDGLGGEIARGELGGAEEQLGQPVDDDPVELLRHRAVEGAQPRLDVGDGNADLCGGQRSGEGRVRVAVDEHPVRLLGEHRRLDPWQHARRLLGVRPRACLQAVLRRVEPELVEEDLREPGIVVLPGVQHDLLGVSREGQGNRSGLYELRPVADDRDDAHRRRLRERLAGLGGRTPLAILARRGR